MKINIAKRMVENERFIGAMTFLSTCKHANYQEYFQILVLWEQCLVYCLTHKTTAHQLAAKTADQELLQLIAVGENSYSDYNKEEKLKVWTDALNGVSANTTIRILENALAELLGGLVNPSKEQIDQIIELALRADVKSDLACTKIQELIETLSVPNLREIYTSRQESKALNFRLILVQVLINKASTVYWEHYNAAQLLVQLGKHDVALEHYVKFFDKALKENDANVIRNAILAASQSLLYVKTIEEHSAYFFSKCPIDILTHPQVARVKQEIDSVIDSRRIFSECRVSSDSEVGYHHLDKEQLEEMRAKGIQLASVHPNYQLFYHLFKVCAALGLVTEAKSWLAQSYEANVQIFKVG